MTSRCAGRTPLKPPPADGDTSAETAASTSIITPSSNRTVYIATIEKANGIVAHCMETKTFGRFGLVIVDELHMIGSGSRGAILEETMTKIVTSPVGIVGLSATIGNLEEIATFLRGETFVGDFRALPLHEFLQVEGTLYKVHGPEDDSLLSYHRQLPASAASVATLQPQPTQKAPAAAATAAAAAAAAPPSADATTASQQQQQQQLRQQLRQQQKNDKDQISILVKEVYPQPTLVFCPTKRNVRNGTPIAFSFLFLFVFVLFFVRGSWRIPCH